MSIDMEDRRRLIESVRSMFASARRHGDPYTMVSTPALLALLQEYDRWRKYAPDVVPATLAFLRQIEDAPSEPVRLQAKNNGDGTWELTVTRVEVYP